VSHMYAVLCVPTLATHLQVAHCLPITCQLPASVIHNAHVTEDVGPTLTNLHTQQTEYRLRVSAPGLKPAQTLGP
jgi:hypothetical protein